MQFPKGTPESLEDLSKWFQEFERVLRHVSGGEPCSEDRIFHFLSCWPEESLPGAELRLVQESPEYDELEQKDELELCWRMLVAKLNEFQVEPVVARRNANDLWKALHWTGDLETYHFSFRKALTACARNHIARTDYDAISKYMDQVPNNFAKYIERKMETKLMMAEATGTAVHDWTLAELFVEHQKFQSIEKSYGGRGQEGGMDRQRAVWNNDKNDADAIGA